MGPQVVFKFKFITAMELSQLEIPTNGLSLILSSSTRVHGGIVYERCILVPKLA